VIEFPNGLQHAQFRANWFNTPIETPRDTEMEEESSESTVASEDELVWPSLNLDEIFNSQE
jgi:hypothetical protein